MLNRVPYWAVVPSFACLFLLAASQARAAELKPTKSNVPYASPAHERQVLDVYAPKDAKNAPVVFWIHGGGWQTGDKTSVQDKPQAFVDKGFVFVSTNYRLLPDVDMGTIIRDVAKSFHWMHDHIAEYGGDPNRVFVMGHSAGAQLAALLCTDDRYLRAEGLNFDMLVGCVPVDGDTYDVPAIIETAETRRRVHGQQQAKYGHREKFGNDPEKHRDFSAVTHIQKGKGIPPFLILYVANHPDTSAQAERLATVLKEAAVPVRLFAAKGTDHSKLNEDLGHADDPATKALFEFVDEALKTQSADDQAVVIEARDYPNLQAAFDALPAAGGELRLPPGTVEITEPLRLHRGDVRLIGAGTSTHIVNKNESGKPALIVAPSADELKKDAKSRLWRVELTDFRITGNPKSGNGIEAVHIDELFVEGVSSSYHGGDGLHMKDCYEDPRIIGCLFTYNKGCGVLIDGCHDIVVSANQFEEDEDALKCTDSFNLCMNGNNIDDHLRHGIIIENTYGSVVSGNMIEECNGTAIILDRDCYGITLSANVIAHHLKGGIDLKDAWGCSVSANTLVLVHEFGIRAGKDSGRLAITGNNFSNSEIGGKLKRINAGDASDPMQRDAGSGISLDGTEDVVISGNQFSGLGTAAVSTAGKCKRLAVQGNLAAECGKLLKDKSAWFDLRHAEDSEVAGNIPKDQVAQ